MRNCILLLFTAAILALLAPLRPTVASAQLEETPILGEPVVVTPLVTPAATTPVDAPAQPEPNAPSGPASPGPARTAVATAPDACEPNNDSAQACLLPLDAVSGPFTVVPEDDQDFYRLDLPQEPSIQTVITVRATAGLDLVLAARQGEALIASGTYSLTLDPSVASPVVLRVENRDPRPAVGEQYRIEVRREIVPPRHDREDVPSGPAPDALENNWSFATAAPVAVGVVYDLSFVCPEARSNACPGGDHDYLQVPVKAGVAYLLATFDLDPGVDTVIELFWGDGVTAAAGNDDYAPGGMLSALRWTAPHDGLLAVRVAPRNGGLPQRLAAATTAYRFAVAPVASELARKLEAQIRQQANVPTPTATMAAPPPSGVSPGGGAGAGAPDGGTAGGSVSTGAQETITTGPAIIVRATVLRREPSEQATALATLDPETLVTVRGPVRGLWISVDSAASMLPGWVRWSDLRRATEASNGSATAQVEGNAAAISQQSSVAGTTAPATPAAGATAAGGQTSSTARVSVTQLDPALPAPPPAPLSRVPFALAVVVVATDRPPTGGGTLGFATPTPDMRQPIGQVRVQLVSVFGDVLAEGLTDGSGRVQLRRDLRPGDALRVRMPAWGVELPLASDQSTLVITIPEGER